MNARVPSIGSSTQRSRASGPIEPEFLAEHAVIGVSFGQHGAHRLFRVRSAMVTGERSDFRSAAKPARKNGRTTAPATSAAASAAATNRSISAWRAGVGADAAGFGAAGAGAARAGGAAPLPAAGKGAGLSDSVRR